MRIAILTAQQQKEGFDPDIPVSLAAMRIQEVDLDTLDKGYARADTITSIETIEFFEEKDMEDMFKSICKSDVSVLVVFNQQHTLGLLKKYYHDTVDISKDFYIFDIQAISSKAANKRLSIDMIGKAFDTPRKVTSGLTYVTFWKDNEIGKLKDAMKTDIVILMKAFRDLMIHKRIACKFPFSENVLLFRSPSVISDLRERKTSFAKRVNSSLETLRDLADETQEGLERKYFFSDSVVDYILREGLAHSYVNLKGDEIICDIALKGYVEEIPEVLQNE